MAQSGYWRSRAHVYGLGLLLGVLWSISTAVVVATLPDEVDEVPLVQWSFSMLPLFGFVAGILVVLRVPGVRILPRGPGWLAAAEAGAVVAFIGFFLHDLTYAVAQNVFYATWVEQNPGLVTEFAGSGFPSLAVYATLKTVAFATPLLIGHSLVGGVCGAIGGATGGLLARVLPLRRRPAAPSP